jgi:predicted phosphodiesterase
VRYGIVSDIHANLAALRAVLDHMGSVDALWCLGDVVGYGPDPNECLEIVRQRAQLCIPGNHDWAGIGKISTEDFNGDAEAAVSWTRRQLTADNVAYLAGLAETLHEGEFMLAHGSPANPIWEYVLSPAVARVSFDHFRTRFCLVGHTHIPVVFQRESDDKRKIKTVSPVPDSPFLLNAGRFIINPGSVGQPRDGKPEASYAIIDTDHATVEHRRVAYPIEETQNKMVKAGLSPRLVARLLYGW